MYSDSHCHLDMYSIENLEDMLEQAKDDQIDVMIGMGMDLKSSSQTILIARDYHGLRAAVGIHPWNAVLPTREIRRKFEILIDREFVAAIGEIGLDYLRSPDTREVQKELLKYELSLAVETGFPVNVHCRDAHQDMMDILRPAAESGLTGIIHGFTGNRSELQDWLGLGFYISLGLNGIVSNENPGLLDLVPLIPLQQLVTETDATGRLSNPYDVALVVEKLAPIVGATNEEVADITTNNLCRLLNLYI